MKKRVFLVGAAGGVLVSAAGWVPLRVFLPQTVLSNWMPERSVSVQQALGWSAAMAVLLLLTGFVAGRMSGARSRFLKEQTQKLPLQARQPDQKKAPKRGRTQKNH